MSNSETVTGSRDPAQPRGLFGGGLCLGSSAVKRILLSVDSSVAPPPVRQVGRSSNFHPGTLNFHFRSSVGYPRKRAADLGKFARQLDPPLAAVGAGEELTVVAARENQVGIGGMGREALHMSVRCDGQQRLFPRVT